MKKKLAIVLAIVLMLSLAACGGGASNATAQPTPAEASQPAEATQPAEEAQPSEAAQPTEAAPPAENETAAVEPLNIMFSSTFQETETGGKIVKHFCDYIEEISGGAITVTMYWGGTLFSDMEQLDGVAEGAVNMVALGHMPHTGTLNYLAFPGFAPGGTQAALDYFNELMFNNPETSALVQEEAAAYGIKYLNVLAGGANAFCTKYEFTDLDSMIADSSSFGNMDAAIFEMLGFQVTSVAPWDAYDGLQRGLIDSTQMGFAPMVSMGWYEVAPYWAIDGTYTAGNFFTVNLNWWNGLSAGQQALIEQAAKEVEAYSASIYDEAIASDIAIVEAATGNTFVEFSSADVDRFWAATFEAKADAAIGTAAPNGKEAGMIKILEVAADITNYDWQH